MAVGAEQITFRNFFQYACLTPVAVYCIRNIRDFGVRITMMEIQLLRICNKAILTFTPTSRFKFLHPFTFLVAQPALYAMMPFFILAIPFSASLSVHFPLLAWISVWH